MLKRIHDRLGTAGLIVGVIALVMAMAGGAWAAKGGLTGKQKKEVKSIATTVAKGMLGTGPQGPAGAKGDPGSAGSAGTNGTNGEDGEDGEDGKSIELTPVAPGVPECEERGGALLEEEGGLGPGVEVCNGEEGSPWTAGGTLPPGASEAGAWAAVGGVQKFFTEVEGVKEEVTVGDEDLRAAISFAIRLPGALAGTNVHYSTEANYTDFDEGGTSHLGCAGNSGGVTAPPGHLCVAQGNVLNATFLEIKNPAGGTKGAAAVGGFVRFTVTGSPARASGGFAVTGPCTVEEPLVEEETEPGVFKIFCQKAS